VTEEIFWLTQIKNTIVDQFLNVSKEFKNFANFFTQKVKVFLTHESHDHTIDIEKSRIILWDSLYNFFAVKLIAQKMYIEKQLQANMIRYFISSAEALMLFTSKKDETLWSYVNYWELNAIILKNRCSLLLINEALDHLADVKWFIKLDIKNAFNKLCIWEEDEWKTTFHMRFDLYEYLVMLFDLINASTFFQNYMNQTLFEFLNIICLVYLNDILIFNKTCKKHVHYIQQILDKLQILKLYIKLFKCKFFKKELFFLKYKVEKKEISMKKNWLQIIQDWSQLRMMKKIQTFLDFVNFYHQFIKNYSRIISFLINHLKTSFFSNIKKRRIFKEQTKWIEFINSAWNAFQKLKVIFAQNVVLQHFNSAKVIKLKMNVFEFAKKLIMFQQTDITLKNLHWHSIVIWSRKWQLIEQNYDAHDQKMLMIVESMNYWKHYLEETWHEIKIINNHANLQHFMTIIKLFCKQMKWINRFTAYNFKIFYQKKVSNFVNDSSRRLNYEQDINVNEREFTHDLAYMKELLKNLLSQSASTLIIFTRQFKTLSIKNHERIIIKSFKKIINLSAFTRRIRKVSQTLKKFSTADEKSQWWFQNIIISRQKNICSCKNIESTFTTVIEIKEDVCSCKNIESTFTTVAETKEDICFHENIKLMFITVAKTERNIIQMRWKRRRTNSSVEESQCLIMSQSKDSITCRSVKKSECLIISQSESSTMCHSAREWMFDHESKQSFSYASFCQEEWVFDHESKQSFDYVSFCWRERMFDHESEQNFRQLCIILSRRTNV